MSLTAHQLRCLGALAALIEQKRNPTPFYKRWDIGGVVYSTSQGVHLKTMMRLRDRGLVRSEIEQAVDLVYSRICTCGCDRWTLTESGRDELRRQNVKVPELPKLRRPTGVGTGLGFGGFGDDPTFEADWWKNGGKLPGGNE
jgi:hypothetical protein